MRFRNRRGRWIELPDDDGLVDRTGVGLVPALVCREMARRSFDARPATEKRAQELSEEADRRARDAYIGRR
jgi:hypothetical protein